MADAGQVPQAAAKEAIAEQLNPPAEAVVQPAAEVQPAAQIPPAVQANEVHGIVRVVRGCLHDTGATFAPGRVHSGSLS